ncbi:MAG TPA: MFS transporter [Syntrophorhabdales bacterium]|nr:MFS transporter [Syntrophorhabdales bacterium]
MSGRFNLKILLLLSAGHCVVDIYQGALPAVLPFLKEALGLNYTVAGVILIMANITSSILQPVFGYVSDKKEKPLLLPVGVLGAGVGFALLSLPSTLLPVLMLVMLSGLGIAAYHPEGYKTAYFHTGPRAATGMSVFSVGGNAGMALGPIIAIPVVSYFGFGALPVVMLPALLFAAVITYLRKEITIPEHLQHEKEGRDGKPGKAAYLSLALVVSVVVMRSWMQMGLLSYIPFYYINHLKGDAVYAGQLISIFLLGGAVGTLAGAPLADRWGYRFFICLSMAVAALTFPLIFLFERFPLLLSLTLFWLGMILVSTFSVTVVMSQRLLPKSLGIASGLTTGFAIGAGGIGVTLLGIVADRYGVPFALKSIFIFPVVGFLLALILKNPVRGKA